MIADIKTILWKESKGLLRPSGNRARTLATLLVPVFMLGIVLPLQMGEEWLDKPWSLAASFLIPVILIGMSITESFAGERERHTLETLLACRLPDRAILFGKLIISFLYGWLMTLLLLVVSLVVVNLIRWNGQVRSFPLNLLLGNITLSCLASGVLSTLGVLVSLRAATVQSAQQTLMLAAIIPLVLSQILVFLLPTFVPVETLREMLSKINFSQILVMFFVLLLAVNAGLFMAVIVKFQRSKLTLEQD